MIEGAAHRRIVDELMRAWTEGRSAPGMSLHVMEGATGSGKSAIVQAFYERLMSTQSSPYWPPSLVDDSPVTGAAERRRRADVLCPRAVSPPPSAVPSLFWWALTARGGGDEDAFAVFSGRGQLAAHIDHIAAAVQAGDELTGRRLAVAARGVLFLSGLAPLEGVVGAVVGGIDKADQAWSIGHGLRSALASRQDRLDTALQRNAGTTFSVTRRGAALAQAEADARALALVTRIVPLIVVVDHAHRLDSITIRLLQTLRRARTAQGMIILLARTDEPTFVAMSPWDRTLTEWLDSEQRGAGLDRHLVPHLTDDELRTLVIAEVNLQSPPAASFRAVIQTAGGSPGRLYALLDSPAVKAALMDDAGELPSDLAQLAAADSLSGAFDQLPAHMRLALATVAVHGPATISSWFTENPTVTPVVEDLLDARWLQHRLATPGAIEFTSDAAWRAASDAIARELNPMAIREEANLLVERVHTLQATLAWTAVDHAMRESLLVAATSFVTEREALCDDLCAGLLTLRTKTGRASPTGMLEDVADRAGEVPTTLAVAAAEAFFSAGQNTNAFVLLRADVEARIRRFGRNAPQTLPAMHSLAAAYAAYGHDRRGYGDGRESLKHAIALYHTILAARLGQRPVHQASVLRTRLQLAETLADDDQYSGAVAVQGAAVKQTHSTLGPDHHDTLAARNSFASWLGHAGRVEEAAAQFQVLLDDWTRVLGPDDPYTLVARNNLATWLGEAGKVEAAVAQFRVLLDDQTRVLGPEHPHTLVTRSNLASALGRAGRVEEAVAQFQVLLDDRTRVLGRDHRDTFLTRTGLASWLGAAGRVEEAVAQLRVLGDDETRVLGPDHPHTLETRNDLAAWLGRTERIEEAAEQLQAILEDRTRVLGRAHPDTFVTRNNLASLLGQAGAVEEALAQFQVLLDDRTRLLGRDHPDTLLTRNNLAVLLGRAGRVEEEAAQLRVIYDDEARVLGADHPQTLTTRHNLADSLGRLGRVKEAVAQFELLLDARVRVLGPEHPDTLLTRNNLAFWLGASGKV